MNVSTTGKDFVRVINLFRQVIAKLGAAILHLFNRSGTVVGEKETTARLATGIDQCPKSIGRSLLYWV